MEFSEIPVYTAISRLNDIRVATTAAEVEFTVRLGATEILRETLKTVSGGADVYGAGDAIAAFMDGVPLQSVTIGWTDPADATAGSTRSVYVVNCRMRMEEEDASAFLRGTFLQSAGLTVVPAGAPAVLTAAGPDIKGAVRLTLGTGTIAPRPEGAATYYPIRMPAVPQVVTARLGSRIHQFIVTDRELHMLSYRNLYGAREYLYLPGRMRTVRERSSGNAMICGERAEYDVRTEVTIEFEGKGLLPATAESAALLPYATGMELDGIPIVVTEMNVSTGHDEEEDTEIKFKGTTTADRIPAKYFPEIFQNPFDETYR